MPSGEEIKNPFPTRPASSPALQPQPHLRLPKVYCIEVLEPACKRRQSTGALSADVLMLSHPYSRTCGCEDIRTLSGLPLRQRCSLEACFLTLGSQGRLCDRARQAQLLRLYPIPRVQRLHTFRQCPCEAPPLQTYISVSDETVKKTF